METMAKEKSRQQRWQDEQWAQGNCRTCGQKRVHYAHLCDACQEIRRRRVRRQKKSRPWRPGRVGQPRLDMVEGLENGD